MKKGLVFILMSLLVCALLTGCGNSKGSTKEESITEDGSSGEQSGGSESIKVGFSLKTVENPFVISVKNGAAKAAEELGAEIIITDAQKDSAKQTSDIESLIQQKVNVLLVDALDSTSIVSTIEEAYDQGMTIVTEDVRIPDAGDMISTHVGIDNKESGKVLAQYLVDKLKEENKSKVIILEGLPGAEATLNRAEGYHEILDNDADIEVIDFKNVGDSRAEGLTVMDDMLQKYSEIDAVICANDELALGAISAITDAGREGIVVCGFDGTSDGLEAVKSGSMLATIDHEPYSMGYLAVEAAIKAAKGESLTEKTFLETTLITSDNVDDAITRHANEK